MVAESKMLYWMDWTWDRSEEGLLAIRFYWWCAQFGLVMVSALVHTHGWGFAYRRVVMLVNWRYVYDERHSWTGTDEEPVSAVQLIITLRRERAEQHAQRTLAQLVEQSTQSVQITRRITPLMDRREDYWDNKPPLTSRVDRHGATPSDDPYLWDHEEFMKQIETGAYA